MNTGGNALTEHTANQDDQEQHVRRPYGYRPRLVPTGEGRALGELLTRYGEGEIDLDEVGAYVMSTRERTSEPAGDGGFVDDFTSPKSD